MVNTIFKVKKTHIDNYKKNCDSDGVKQNPEYVIYNKATCSVHR